MNKILEEYGFKYRFLDLPTDPTNTSLYAVSSPDIWIAIDHLSSGEQQLIMLIAWAYHEIIADNIRQCIP